MESLPLRVSGSRQTTVPEGQLPVLTVLRPPGSRHVLPHTATKPTIPHSVKKPLWDAHW
jgi:hypothetical protein